MTDLLPVLNLLKRLNTLTYGYPEGASITEIIRPSRLDLTGREAETRLVLRRLEQAGFVEVGPGGWRTTAGAMVWQYMLEHVQDVAPDRIHAVAFRLGDTMLADGRFDRWSYHEIFQGIERMHVRGFIRRKADSELYLTPQNPLN